VAKTEPRHRRARGYRSEGQYSEGASLHRSSRAMA